MTAFPATGLIRRDAACARLDRARSGAMPECDWHEIDGIQAAEAYIRDLPAAQATDEEIDRVAKALWVRDGLPEKAFDKGVGIIGCKPGPGGGTVREPRAPEIMRDAYRTDARKIVSALGLGGNVE